MTQLSIPAPCSEKWSDMKPVRFDCHFCAACEKQIVDFTGKTDAEILEHLKKGKGKICGRFSVSQLDRPIQPAFRNRAIGARRGGLTAAAASVAALLSAQQPADNQKVAPASTEQYQRDMTTNGQPVTNEQPEKQDSIRTISGKVVDAETSEALLGATVIVPGTHFGTITDTEGMFSLELPLQMVQDQDIRLTISYIGLTTKAIMVPTRIKEEDLSLLPIELSPMDFTETTLVGVIVVGKPTLGQRFSRFFHRLFH